MTSMLSPAAPARLVVGMAETRGIVDQDVDAAQSVTGGLDVGLDLLAISQVADPGMNLAAMPAEGGSCLVEASFTAGANGHGCAVPGKSLGDGAADAATTAAHDDAFALEIELHVMLSQARDGHVHDGAQVCIPGFRRQLGSASRT